MEKRKLIDDPFIEVFGPTYEVVHNRVQYSHSIGTEELRKLLDYFRSMSLEDYEVLFNKLQEV